MLAALYFVGIGSYSIEVLQEKYFPLPKHEKDVKFSSSLLPTISYGDETYILNKKQTQKVSLACMVKYQKVKRAIILEKYALFPPDKVFYEYYFTRFSRPPPLS